MTALPPPLESVSPPPAAAAAALGVPPQPWLTGTIPVPRPVVTTLLLLLLPLAVPGALTKQLHRRRCCGSCQTCWRLASRGLALPRRRCCRCCRLAPDPAAAAAAEKKNTMAAVTVVSRLSPWPERWLPLRRRVSRWLPKAPCNSASAKAKLPLLLPKRPELQSLRLLLLLQSRC